jgi:hypothetical protein
MKADHVSYPVLKEIENNLNLLKDRRIALVWGCRDFCFTTHFLKRWQEIFPEAESFLFETAGHYVLEDAKDEVIKLISEFLK